MTAKEFFITQYENEYEYVKFTKRGAVLTMSIDDFYDLMEKFNENKNTD